MTRLSSSSPVTASTRSGGLAMPARSSTKISVASPSMATWPNSSSSRSKRSRCCSTSVTSWPMPRSERVTFAPTLPPPATITYIGPDLRGTGGLQRANIARAHRVGDDGDRRLRWTDRAEAALRVEVGPGRVEHAHDDAPDPVALLRDLADQHIRVVTVGRDDDGVGVLDARAPEDAGVHAVPDEEAAAPTGAEASERVLVLVDDSYAPALARELHGNRRADAPAADHDRLH